MFRRLRVHLREGFKGLWRNKGLAFTSMITMSVTLLFVSAAMILSINVNHFTKLVKEDLSLSVYLNLDVTVSEGQEIAKEFAKYDYVASSDFSSKEQERVHLLDDEYTPMTILEFYEGDKNPLNNAIYIKVTDVDQIESVKAKIEAHEGVEEVTYLKDIVDSLLFMFEIIQLVGISIIVALLLVTLVVISNTIKITVFSRRRSIEIMRLIGAKKSYIVAPHIVEGLLIGVLGSILPMFGTYFGYKELYTRFTSDLVVSPFLKLVNASEFMSSLLLAILAVGVVVSVLGSRRSVRKFMRGK